MLQDVATYEQTQETLAPLKILALGQREAEQGKVTSLHATVGRRDMQSLLSRRLLGD